jgi:hypothetical protein
MKYCIKSFRRCARTGSRIHTRRVVQGAALLAEHITLAAPSLEPPLAVIPNFDTGQRYAR